MPLLIYNVQSTTWTDGEGSGEFERDDTPQGWSGDLRLG
jgi:hypothetical protein